MRLCLVTVQSCDQTLRRVWSHADDGSRLLHVLVVAAAAARAPLALDGLGEEVAGDVRQVGDRVQPAGGGGRRGGFQAESQV